MRSCVGLKDIKHNKVQVDTSCVLKLCKGNKMTLKAPRNAVVFLEFEQSYMLSLNFIVNTDKLVIMRLP